MDDGRVVAVSAGGRYSFSKPVRDGIELIAGLGVAGDVHAGATIKHRHRLRWDRGQPNLRQVHLIQGELFDELHADGWEVSPGQLGENVTTRGIDLLRLPRGTVLRFAGPEPAGSRGVTAGGGVLSGGVGVGDGANARGKASSGSGEDAGGAEAPGDRRSGGGDVLAGVREAAAGSKLTKAAAAAMSALVEAGERVDRAEPDTGADGRAVVVLTGMRTPCGQIDGFQDGLLGQVAYHDAEGQLVQKAGVMGVVLRGGPVRPGDGITVELPPEPHEPLGRV
jgi:MOSC domain-containing protein YiiM